MNCIQSFNARHIAQLTEGRAPIPTFGPGDTLSVYIRIKEGDRERVQRFEGLCIARRDAGIHSSFLVRRVSGGFGIERRFPLYSPLIERIECLRRGRVRRNKLYYVRDLSRKEARIPERRSAPAKATVSS